MAGLVVLTMLLYRAVVDLDYVDFDDAAYLSEQVRNGLNWENVWMALSTPILSLWTPLVSLSFMVDIELFGYTPRVFHVGNVLLHTLNVVLFYRLVARMLIMGNMPCNHAALLAALLLAVHPQHVEAVAWISERKEMLAALFGLLSLHGYLQWAVDPRWWWRVLVGCGYLMSLSAKPMWITLPCILLLLDAWPLQRWRGWLLVVEKWPLFLIALLFSGLTLHLNQGERALTFDLLERLRYMGLIYGMYLEKSFFPVDLAVFYPLAALQQRQWWESLGWLGVLAGMTLLLWRMPKTTRPPLLMGWVWYLGATFPVSGIAQTGFQSMADRFTYMPHMGLALTVALGWETLRQRMNGVAYGVAVGMVVTLMWLTLQQIPVWRNTESLWQHAIRVIPGSSANYRPLGQYYLDHGELDKAMIQFQRAAAINPQAVIFRMEIMEIYLAIGKAGEAMQQVAQAVTLPQTPSERVRLTALVGKIYLVQGLYPQAEMALSAAVADPAIKTSEEVWYNLGVARLLQHQVTSGLKNILEAKALDRGKVMAWCQGTQRYLGHPQRSEEYRAEWLGLREVCNTE